MYFNWHSVNFAKNGYLKVHQASVLCFIFNQGFYIENIDENFLIEYFNIILKLSTNYNKKHFDIKYIYSVLKKLSF